MLPETEIVAAIDVGTTKVCTVVGRKSGKRGLEVLGYSSVPCRGLRKGNVTDGAATANAIRESIRNVEQSTGRNIQSAFVGVTGSHVGFTNRKDKLDDAGTNGVITSDDMNRTPKSLKEAAKEPGRDVLHTIRTSYTLDGESGIRNPVGMHSENVEVETHVVTAGKAFVQRLVDAVEEAGITVKSLVLEPLASGMAVLTSNEKERGTVLVDIGGGTTDVVGFKQGRVYYTGVIPVGGYQFTNDIAMTYNTPYEDAEDAKLKHASADIHAARPDEFVRLSVEGRDDELQVPRQEICQLVRERAFELSRMVKLKLDNERIDPADDVRLVVTGGASNLPGLAPVMEKNLGIPVRQGVPKIDGDVPIELKDPTYATGLGILVWATTDYVPEAPPKKTEPQRVNAKNRTGVLDRLLVGVNRMLGIGLFVTRKGRI